MKRGDYLITKSFDDGLRRLFVLDGGELMEYDSNGVLEGGYSRNLKSRGELIGSLSSIEVIRLIGGCYNVGQGDLKNDFIVPCDEMGLRGHDFNFGLPLLFDKKLITRKFNNYHFFPELWQVWDKERNLVGYSHSLDVRIRRGQKLEMPEVLLDYFERGLIYNK